jgi:hypothetical protein
MRHPLRFSVYSVFPLAAAAAAVTLGAAGCGDAPDGVNLNPACQAISLDCALPWPSSFYLKPDSSTATGWRVDVPPAALPEAAGAGPFDTGRLALLDGFSAAGALVANVKARVAVEQLVPHTDIARSLEASARTQLFRFDTGERVPHFSEVDANAGGDDDQVVLMSPAVRLQPKTRYVAVLRDLLDVDGKKITVAPFEALKARRAHPRLDPLRARYDEIFALLESKGVPRSSVTLAWDFVTASDELVLANLIGMRDRGLAEWAARDLGITITETKEGADAGDHLVKQLKGTFSVPSFLESDARSAVLKLDAAGVPQLRGVQEFPLSIHVPACATTATAPLPIMVFGHGLFGSAEGEMGSGYQRMIIDRLCMVQVGTDWTGLSNDDFPNAANAATDLDTFPTITDRLQQAQLNFLVLARLAKTKLKDHPALQLNGRPIVDGNEVYYYGISQGGIEGGTFLALSPDVRHGVLSVGAGIYSLLLPRSTNFTAFKIILDGAYPSSRDQQLLLAMLQSYWDYSDPISFTPYLVKSPLPGLDGKPLAPRRFVMQEGIGDAQVSNIATRIWVRTAGVPYVGKAVEPPFGIEEVPGPVEAGYTQWDIGATPLPPTVNTPPSAGNDAHEGVRRLEKVIQQIDALLSPDGRVVDTCGGKPCREPNPFE